MLRDKIGEEKLADFLIGICHDALWREKWSFCAQAVLAGVAWRQKIALYGLQLRVCGKRIYLGPVQFRKFHILFSSKLQDGLHVCRLFLYDCGREYNKLLDGTA